MPKLLPDHIWAFAQQNFRHMGYWRSCYAPPVLGAESPTEFVRADLVDHDPQPVVQRPFFETVIIFSMGVMWGIASAVYFL